MYVRLIRINITIYIIHNNNNKDDDSVVAMKSEFVLEFWEIAVDEIR